MNLIAYLKKFNDTFFSKGLCNILAGFTVILNITDLGKRFFARDFSSGGTIFILCDIMIIGVTLIVFYTYLASKKSDILSMSGIIAISIVSLLTFIMRNFIVSDLAGVILTLLSIISVIMTFFVKLLLHK